MIDLKITIQEGSTNVYTDLGYTDAAAMQRKSQLASEIGLAIKAGRLPPGVDRSDVSRIMRGQFRGVSETKLLELVTSFIYEQDRATELGQFRPA